MDLGELRAHCLAKPSVEESYPFGRGALVMKVAGKVFVIVGEDDRPLTVSLKCEPEIAVVLRERYPSVTPGYHLNKRHWNTVVLDGSVPEQEIFDWIDDSFDLVVEGLPGRVRAGINHNR